MTTHCATHSSLLFLGLAMADLPPAADPAPTTAPVAWTFDAPGDLQGWQPNAQLTNVALQGGVLECQAVGPDPILELTAPLELPASPWQFLEARLRADRDGTGEWFWSGTREGRFGGFSQEKSTRFRVRGDGQWQTIRVFPFWQKEGRIVRLRLDLFDGAQFALDTLGIGELALPDGAATPGFVFTNTTHGWQAVGALDVAPQPTALALSAGEPDAFLLAPPVRFEAESQSFVSLELAVDRGRHATLLYATDASPGLHHYTFALETAPGAHTYNLDLLATPNWRGRILALGLQPSDAPGAQARLAWLEVGSQPRGAPRLKVRWFGAAEALLRTGRPTILEAVVVNVGATPVTDLEAVLELPHGLRDAGTTPAPGPVASLEFDEEATFRWTIQADEPGNPSVRLELHSANTPSVRTNCQLSFSPPLDLPPTDYVPEPVPVRGPFEVGAYYFPGWRSAGQWQPLRGYPERRPLLGWYREGDPEVADWHIKWAVEHGLTFLAYDWYWSEGARQLEHALHKGYFRARYRHRLKFCLLWANHNAPGTHSQEDCVAVTRHWITHYFRRPEHLTVAGQPVLIIFSPQRLTEDLGSDGVRRALTAMREECRGAGLPGLCLLACVGDTGEARRAAAEGYDAVTAYTWPGLGMTGEGMFAPFAPLLEGYRRQWEQLEALGLLPLVPPLCGGWDSRPWHGDNNLVRYDRTPALFRQHLADARQFLEHRATVPRPGAGPSVTDGFDAGLRRLVLIEAWNEWGEGAYIEPHREFGFGYLDAIREVFTDAAPDHVDFAPADVGLGPYDVPLDAPGQTRWSFATSDEGWGSGMNLADVQTQAGALTARTAGRDPAFFGPPLQLRARDFPAVELRLKLTATNGIPAQDAAQLFWRTTRLPESEATSVRFPVAVDGRWHDYRLELAENVRWRGMVTRLRLDPVSRPGIEVALDELRFVPKP
jgi:hypothetical protein